MRKKLLFIINSLNCGGAEKLLIDIVNNLDSSKYEIGLLVFRKKLLLKDKIHKPIKILNTLNGDSIINKYLFIFLKKIGIIDNYYKYKIRKTTTHYDTIISFLEGFPLRAHSYIFDRAKNHISYIHTDLRIYNDCFDQFKNEESISEIYNKLDKIICVSNETAKGFKSVLPQIKTPVYPLHNFIDIENVIKDSLSQSVTFKVPTIITVGRLEKIKGLEIIPRIAKLFKKENIKIQFRIVGDGTEYGSLKQLITELNVDDFVILEGYVSNPYPLIKASDIYLSTSLAEGLPLSICEAMALKKPIISTPTSGALNLLSGGAGILVERDEYKFFYAIRSLLNSKELMLKYSMMSSNKANEFDKSIYLNKLYSIIDKDLKCK